MVKGYPHDFGHTNGKMHPVTLHPGETYGAMPASHAMQKTIDEQQEAVFNTLKTAIENTLLRLTQ
jgi:glucosamine 6-phosphate synthetase-like amidotransferase/phosphosugar isomerase protein